MNGKVCWGRWSAVLLALALTACDGGGGGGGGGGGTPGDVTPPAIVSTLPVDGASGVTRTTAVTATFSESVAPASVTASTFSLSAGALPVSGSLTVSGPLVTFTPSAPLALATLFTARVAVGITDLAGNALTAPFTWNFTTEAAPWPGTRQLGTTTIDTGNAVAVDSAGNIYVAGGTGEDLDGVGGGDPLFGGTDFFLAKFDPSGNLLFTRQLGTVAADEARGVAVDGEGNVYVTGSTSGDLDGVGFGDPLFGGTDFFLAKFDPLDGTLIWSRQLGTVPADEARGVAVDGAGNIYVAGSTAGDLDGVGFGDPLFGGTDFFLANFDPAGNFLGTRQLGTTATDEANGVSVDGAGNVYVAGSTAGDLDGLGFGDPLFGGTDFFLARFDSSGSLLFTRQFGTVPTDSAFGAAVARLGIGGNVFVSGETLGGLDGNLSAGNFDLFLAKVDPFGNLQ